MIISKAIQRASSLKFSNIKIRQRRQTVEKKATNSERECNKKIGGSAKARARDN